jgi:heme-degrading monooxygenase HmoA
MYGTVARYRAKPGAQQQLADQARAFDAARVPGFVAQHIYRMDSDPDVYYVAVIFESKDAYTANAHSPEQDARYQQLRALLVEDPEWHDGELVYSTDGG